MYAGSYLLGFGLQPLRFRVLMTTEIREGYIRGSGRRTWGWWVHGEVHVGYIL